MVWAPVLELSLGGRFLKRNTVLDKIIEFAKVSAVLNFYVRATLRLRASECPPDTDVLKISSLPKRESSKRLLRPLPICLDIYFIFNMSLCDCANRTVGVLIRSFPLRQTQNRSDGVPDKTTARRNELRNHLFAN